ncbi:MAG TPA: T9SS type A sorting domain-containing protein [Flavipsychrobacter sp.]|nr:T9SS type A sorting domain-containing protein [Flavipsychrobacter sp.]
MKKPILFSVLLLLLSAAAIAQPLLKRFDLQPGKHSNPVFLTPVGGKLFFEASNGPYESELYVSDGTDTGTHKVPNTIVGYAPRAICDYNGKAIFSYLDSVHGNELWISDGTSSGTYMIKDINPGKASGFSSSYSITYNGKVYFGGNDGIYGTSLWCTDGTAAGTQMVADLIPGPTDAEIKEFVISGGKLYFNASDSFQGHMKLWVTDGTTAGTQCLRSTCGSFPCYSMDSPTPWLTAYNNKVYFSAQSLTYGTEIWTSDGTNAGTHILKDINPGSGSGFSTGIWTKQPQVFNNKLYFEGTNGTNGIDIWETDGTTTGTSIAIDLAPFIGANGPTFYHTVASNRLFFFVYNQTATNAQMICTDGTQSGTRSITFPDSMRSITSPPVAYRNRLYVPAAANGKMALLSFVDTSTVPQYASHAYPIMAPGSTPYMTIMWPTVCDSSLFFTAPLDTAGTELWMLRDTVYKPVVNPITINKILHTNNITLYPNPTHHNFTIKARTAFKAGSITLTDATGRVVKTEKLYNNEQTISLHGIAPGVYMADVWLDDKRTTQKLVIE